VNIPLTVEQRNEEYLFVFKPKVTKPESKKLNGFEISPLSKI
jgi:hypothetical protein